MAHIRRLADAACAGFRHCGGQLGAQQTPQRDANPSVASIGQNQRDWRITDCRWLSPLDEQARVLGLSRSTTWSITRAKHKTTGLSASVIKRMLAQPQLPTETRIAIREYAEQKSAGTYGHNSAQVRRFVAQIKSPVLDPQRSRARRVLDLEPRCIRAHAY